MQVCFDSLAPVAQYCTNQQKPCQHAEYIHRNIPEIEVAENIHCLRDFNCHAEQYQSHDDVDMPVGADYTAKPDRQHQVLQEMSDPVCTRRQCRGRRNHAEHNNYQYLRPARGEPGHTMA